MPKKPRIRQILKNPPCHAGRGLKIVLQRLCKPFFRLAQVSA